MSLRISGKSMETRKTKWQSTHVDSLGVRVKTVRPQHSCVSKLIVNVSIEE